MNAEQGPDDRDLLQAIASGDRGAMKTLYERHYAAVHKFICSRSIEPSAASDILHDTMLDVWRSADRFAGRASVKTWMFSIAKNKIIDRYRKAKRTETSDKGLDLVDDSPGPFEALARSQDITIVRDAIKELSAEHRAAIHLAFVEELPYAEIAEIEGVAVGTIKTRIFHAKRRLARLISKQDPD
ncbi:MAG: sigma-70 family RNA polymerase sigma factor [Pseudomonadota bacterium]